jgi:hypothetical protein
VQARKVCRSLKIGTDIKGLKSAAINRRTKQYVQHRHEFGGDNVALE